MKRMVVLPWVIWAVVAVTAISSLFYCSAAQAEPLAVAVTENLTITLFNEPCDLPEVSNLPQRAEWREASGKTYRGCWRFHPFGVVVLYFLEDKSVAIVPGNAFQKATGV